MKENNISKYVSIWIIVLTFIHTSLQHKLPLGTYGITLIINFILLIITFHLYFKHKYNNTYYWVNLYLLFILINTIRGGFTASGYYEYKHLIQGIMSSIIPLFLFLFLNKNTTLYIWKKWFRYGLLIYFIYFIWFIKFDPFYFSPLLFLFCYFPLLKKQKKTILILAILYIIASYLTDSRAPLGKAVVSLLFGVAIYYKKFITKRILSIAHKFAYLSFILIFAYVFTDFISIMFENKDKEELNVIENYGVDTRSLLYYDIINSAIYNDYYIFGRTPARGNDINSSAILFINNDTDITEFVRGERHANEVLHGNIFTWYGVIGLFIYFMIYYKASNLAIQKSNNIYISLLGCYVAFRWSFGWIEDCNNFNILNISLWSMIGMCYSTEFRSMTNRDFENWINQII